MTWPIFRFGMRQSAARLNLRFALPAHLSFEDLDQWINEALETDPQAYQLILVNGPSAYQAEETYLTRLLQVTSILLQDIRVPIFERAAMIDITPDAETFGHFNADLWLPVVEAFPISLFHNWLLIAHDLITSVCACAHNQDKLENIYQNFQQKLVLPWSRQIPGGRSTVPILETAFKLGVPMAHCGSGRYLLGWGSKSRLFDRSSNSQDSAIGLFASHNKDVALNMMRFAGIPIPKGMTFKSSEPITLASLSNLKMPLVVKPVDRDRGEGVTTGICTEDELQQAVATVKKLSHSVLVEEQVEGVCHRVFVVEDKLIYVVKRNPRTVTGDGVHTIEALIDKVNVANRKKIPQKRFKEIKMDQQMAAYLAETKRSFTDTPRNGQKIELRPVQSTEWGGDPVDVTTEFHPENAEIAIRAARLFGLSTAGVDFISTDITVPWYQNGAAINEVNFAPLMGRTHLFQRQASTAYIEQLFPTIGKIPIEVFIGEANKSVAQNRWEQLITAGLQCYFCMETAVLKPDGQPIIFAGDQTMQNHIAMLRANTNVDAIVVHTPDNELFEKEGYPFEDAIFHNSQ